MAVSEERRFQALVLAPVRRVQRRLNAVIWAEAGIAPMWAAVTVCVVARLLLRDMALWGAPVFLLAGGLWWGLRARYRGISLEHAAVLADRSANAGGLLLTRLERPVGDWELSVNQYAGAVKPPEVRWRRPVGALAGALLFLMVGFLLPLPAPTPRLINSAAAAKVAAVQAKAEALAKEEALGTPMEEELRRLAEEVAEGRFDSADWEAADGLDKRLSERAAEAAAELAGAAEAASDLEEALGAAGEAEGAARERENLERALMALSEGKGKPGEGTEGQRGANGENGANGSNGATGERGAAGDGGTGTGGQQGTQGSQGTRSTASAQAGGNLDQISDLRRTLERRQQELENRFGQGNAGQRASAGRQSGSGRQGQGMGQGQGEGQEQGQGQGNGHASRAVQKGGAGTGRGGESEPLVFGGEAEMDPNRLKFQPLPEGQGGEASELWGLKAADPRHEAGTGAPSAVRGPGVQGDATPGYSTGPLLPRNRDLVKRYFGNE